MNRKGFVHLYTGNGKGKTTAAIGLAIRAAGAGMKVFIAQFIKGRHYNELSSLEKFEGQIVIKQYGRDCFIKNEPEEADRMAARRGLDEVEKIVMEGAYDMVVLDEINIALYYKLVDISEVAMMIKKRPEHVELVLTGRYAPQSLIDLSDLVTNMDEIKHYYHNGIEARPGIEY